MTELEEARAHLRECQASLQEARGSFTVEIGLCSVPMTKPPAAPEITARCERAVLAALSWVWDAQERAKTHVRVCRSPRADVLEITGIIGEIHVGDIVACRRGVLTA
jgi:hypothetical protein